MQVQSKEEAKLGALDGGFHSTIINSIGIWCLLDWAARQSIKICMRPSKFPPWLSFLEATTTDKIGSTFITYCINLKGNEMKRALVLGGGGFIGSHMIKRLKQEGFWVRGVDIKIPKFSPTQADDFIVGDLTDPEVCINAINHTFDEIYQFAADMGGAGYIFTGENDADIMHNSSLINLNVLNECKKT